MSAHRGALSPALPVLLLAAACSGASVPVTDPPAATPAVTAITLTPDFPLALVDPGDTASVVALPLDGPVPVPDAPVSWSVSDPAVVALTPLGGARVRLTARGTGQVTVTARAGQASATIAVSAGTLPDAAIVAGTNSLEFIPNTVTIRRGGTVTWRMGTSRPHDVVFDPGTAGRPADVPLGSGTTTARQFGTAGRFDYVCSIHAGMRGTVVVR